LLVLEDVFRISSSEDSSSDGEQRGGQLRGVSTGQNIMIVEERKHAGKLKKRSKQG